MLLILLVSIFRLTVLELISMCRKMYLSFINWNYIMFLG